MPSSKNKRHNPFRCGWSRCLHPACILAASDGPWRLIGMDLRTHRLEAMKQPSVYMCTAMLMLQTYIPAAEGAEEVGAVELIWLGRGPFDAWKAVKAGHAHVLACLLPVLPVPPHRRSWIDPMSLAAQHGHVQVMNLLHKHGHANVEDALKYATGNEHPRAINFARKMGARGFMQQWLQWTNMPIAIIAQLVGMAKRYGNAPLCEKDRDTVRRLRCQRNTQLERLNAEVALLDLCSSF